jgi:transcription antitermination factor NusG
LAEIDSSLNWFALRVRPRCERLVSEALRGKGYEQFLPLHRERHQWSDRIAVVEVPLFAGYVFCRFDVRQRLPILTTPGVQLVVSTGQTPEPIDEEEISSLRILAASRLDLCPWPFVQVGQRIRIVGGALAGAEGLVLSVKSQHRLVVSVTMLQRSVSVEIPESCAWPLPSQTSAGAGRGPRIEPNGASRARGAKGGLRNV